MNWKECGRKQTYSDLRSRRTICLKWLRKPTPISGKPMPLWGLKQIPP